MNRRLAVCCAPQLVIALDFSLLTVSAPALAADLDLAPGTLKWAFSAYSLAFGGVLLLAGRVADVWERKPVLVGGLLTYVVGASGTAAASGGATLIAARALQGTGAAVMVPAALALLMQSFSDARDRRSALAAYGVAVSTGFVVGGILGGSVLAVAGWRTALGAGCLLGAVALVATVTADLPRSQMRPRARGLDVPGAVFACALAVSLSAGVGGGFGRGASAALVAATVIFAALLRAQESRVVDPLLPPQLLRLPATRAACATAALVTGTGVAAVLLLSIDLQEVRGYSSLQTGLAFGAFGCAALLGGRVARVVATAHGSGAVMASGLAIQGVSVGALGVAPSVLPALLTGLAIFGFGHVMANAGVPMVALVDLDEIDHGTVAGVVATASYAGAAIGPLVAFTVATDRALVACGAVAVAGAIAVRIAFRA